MHRHVYIRPYRVISSSAPVLLLSLLSLSPLSNYTKIFFLSRSHLPPSSGQIPVPPALLARVMVVEGEPVSVSGLVRYRKGPLSEFG